MNEYDNVAWKKAKTLHSKQPSASVERLRPQGDVRWRPLNWSQESFMKPKGNNEQAQKCDRYGYNAHKPREKCPAKNESCNKCRKIRHFPKCAEVGKASLTRWIKWTVQEKNIPVMSKVLIGTYILQLLHVASLEIKWSKTIRTWVKRMNGVNSWKYLAIAPCFVSLTLVSMQGWLTPLSSDK